MFTAYFFAFDLAQLYIIEFLFGVSYALQGPSLLSWMMDISDKDKRGLFLGMFESVYDIAGAIAALLSVIIVSRFGFEPLFFMCSGCQATTGFFILKSRKMSR
jgi:MFS family permease